jgi:hypothetical protein
MNRERKMSEENTLHGGLRLGKVAPEAGVKYQAAERSD